MLFVKLAPEVMELRDGRRRGEIKYKTLMAKSAWDGGNGPNRAQT